MLQTGVVDVVALFVLTYEIQARRRAPDLAYLESRYGEVVEALRGKVPIPREDFSTV